MKSISGGFLMTRLTKCPAITHNKPQLRMFFPRFNMIRLKYSSLSVTTFNTNVIISFKHLSPPILILHSIDRTRRNTTLPIPVSRPGLTLTIFLSNTFSTTELSLSAFKMIEVSHKLLFTPSTDQLNCFISAPNFCFPIAIVRTILSFRLIGLEQFFTPIAFHTSMIRY